MKSARLVAISLLAVTFGLNFASYGIAAPNQPERRPIEPNRPPANQPSQRPPAQRPPTQRPPTQRPPTQQPPAQRPPAQRPPTERPPVQRPPAQRPPVQRPPAQRPPVQRPPAQRPPAQRPPISRPPAYRPPVQRPPVVSRPPHYNNYRPVYRPYSYTPFRFRPGYNLYYPELHARYRPYGYYYYPYRDRFYYYGRRNSVAEDILLMAGTVAVFGTIFNSTSRNDNSYGQVIVESPNSNYEIVYIRLDDNRFVPAQVPRGTISLGLQNRDDLLFSGHYNDSTETVYVRTSSGKFLPIEIPINLYSFN